MKRKIILISILIMLQSCASFRSLFSDNSDPYGRVIENIDEEKKKRKLTKTERKVYNEVKKAKTEKRKPKLNAKEQKLYDEIYNNSVKEDKEKDRNEDITLSRDGKEVLRLMKKVYNLIESYDIMERKTIEAVTKIREQKNPDEDTMAVIKEIHQILKETKTRSYTLAVARVMRNRGVK